MIANYLKIAWRNIIRNKGFSLINIIGLTIGISTTIFILLWVQDELSWDKFHVNHKNIYSLNVNRDFNGNINTDNAVQFPLSGAIMQNFPEVEQSVIDDGGQDHVLTYENNILKKKGYTTSGNYFNVFKWKFIKGSAANALNSSDNIVLTESTAKSLFGSTDVLDKQIKMDNADTKKVSAVIQDPPSASTLKFDFIQLFDYSSPFIKNASNDWVNSYMQIYVQLKPGVNIELLNKKITDLSNNHNHQKGSYFLFPMDKWRLYGDFKDGKNTGGLIEYVHLFTIIAIIILIIACVNFMNLSTAKSEKRAKEVGIRKTLGSERKQLLFQFYSEAFIFSFSAYLFSLITVVLLLPAFNSLIGKEVSLHIFEPVFITGSLIIILLTTLIAGSYPAIYLSSFNPVRVLKGAFKTGKSAMVPRKLLVVLQFIISIFLITATVMVYKQIQHVKNRDLGYNPNNLISIPSSPDADKNTDIIKNELTGTNLIAAVTRSSAPITDIWNYSPAPNWDGKPAGSNMIVSAMSTENGFAKVLGVKMLEGRDFSNTPSDSMSMMLNRTAMKLMELKNPIGKQMNYFGKKYTVIGVTDDIVMASPYEPVKPMIIFPLHQGSNFYLLRLKEGVQPQQAISAIATVFKKYNPSFPFEYHFTNDQFNEKFKTEDLILRLTNIFAGLAIFICCLGLSGLTTYTVETRFKEIGIRKVLGASVNQVLFLISKEFLFLAMLSFLISAPLAWWGIQNWLQHYNYRIDVSIGLVVASGVAVLLLTLLTVCINSLKAAMSNPVKNLKNNE